MSKSPPVLVLTAPPVQDRTAPKAKPDKDFRPKLSPQIVEQLRSLATESGRMEAQDRLRNHLLIAEPVPGDPGRYQLKLHYQIPIRWTCEEAEEVIRLTSGWRWCGVLDADVSFDLQVLLENICDREVDA